MDIRTVAALTGALLALSISANVANLPVDVELVIAVDISASMDDEEYVVQRAGYVAAIKDPEFVNQVLAGVEGQIAITYVEWSGTHRQKIVMPWRLIDSAAAARAFSDELASRPVVVERGTSISTALLFSATLFQANVFESARQVIDISGDGPNNYGPSVTFARDFVVAKGIAINGLPIMIRPSPIFPAMDFYYADCVIGGPGAFTEPVRNVAEFRTSIRRKLLEEIRVADGYDGGRLVLASAREPVDCLIGEKVREGTTGQFYPGLDR